MRRGLTRVVWISVGLVSVGLGVLGIVLPLLPTTPFILLAAFAFAQSSERLHRWLIEHRVFGPIVVNWRRHRAIGLRAKVVSLLAMAAVIVLSLALGASTRVLLVQGVVLTACALFIVTRPSPPAEPGPGSH